MSRTKLAALLLSALTLLSVSGGGVATLAASPAAATTVGYCKPVAHTTSVTPNTTYTDYFKQKGPGDIAYDASYAAKLPDGRTAWVFSDTLVGTVNADGTANFTGMPSNTMMVGTGANLKSLYSGSYSSPRSLIPNTVLPDGRHAWWYVSADFVEGSHLLVFVNQVTQAAGDMFATPTGASAIAVFSLPASVSDVPHLQKLVSIANDPDVQWGNGYTYDATYNYIYGLSSSHQMMVARVRRGATLAISKWQFWSGSGWVSGESHAKVVNTTQAEAVSPQPSSWGKGYVAIGVSPFPGNYLTQQFSCSPQGPWSTPETIAKTPETWGVYSDEIAYIPVVIGYHPATSSSLTVLYNINTTDGLGAVAANPDVYRPRVVTIK